MHLIYEPQGMAQRQRDALESALDRDQARIWYIGNDGAREYVIMEAANFRHTLDWGRTTKVPLAFLNQAARSKRG
ncbi:MAG TPA: hypothetical protein VGO93_27720 [Candidatus Xenobia bacterium]|jgi:hypothetical protein